MKPAVKQSPNINQEELIKQLKDLLNDYPVTSFCKLQCIDPIINAYKYYVIEIKEAVGGGFNLTCTYGRINSTQNEKIYIKNGSEKSCRIKAEKLRSEKIKKGYTEVDNGRYQSGLTKLV